MSEQKRECVDAATKIVLAGAAALIGIGIIRIAFGGLTIGCIMVGVTEELK